MKELWKDISGYAGFYQVSNLGRVRSLERFVKGKSGSLRRQKGKLLTASLSEGYPMVGLCKNSNRENVRVHRLVAIAFIPNPEKKRAVNHIDENKLNNCVDNLEWVTDNENANHGNRTSKSSKGRYRPIWQLDLLGKKIHLYPSIKEAEAATGISASKIICVAKGQRNKAGNYKWEYQS